MKIIIFTMLLFASANISAQNMLADEEFKLIELPYATNALEPIIGRQTIELHYDKHLRGYVDKLNSLIADTPLKGESLDEIVKVSSGATYDNAGQVLNHNLYFTQFSPNGGGEPQGALRKAIDREWGTFDRFKQAMQEAGTTLFGSGWVWLAAKKSGELEIVKCANGGNPAKDGLTPLLGFDVWEHAYYLDYNNRRADHLKALWQIVDWPTIENRYKKLTHKN